MVVGKQTDMEERQKKVWGLERGQKNETTQEGAEEKERNIKAAMGKQREGEVRDSPSRG